MLDTLLLRQDTLLLRIDGLNSTTKYFSQVSTRVVRKQKHLIMAVYMKIILDAGHVIMLFRNKNYFRNATSFRHKWGGVGGY
jgi:hypothetical protein